MTRRGRLALLAAGGVYVAAWAFGSTVLYPVAVGLALAVGLAAWWVRAAPVPERVRRETGAGEITEGGDVQMHVDVELSSGVRPPSMLLVERLRRLGDVEVPLDVAGRRAWGAYALRRIPRGRYAFSDTRIVVEDPFGLARAERELEAGGALVVYPRLVRLDGLFSERGSMQFGRASGRLLVRRPAGLELHGVREYQDGESLRAVHWPSTAKRSRLMVRDLEDAPREDVAVVLDARAGIVAGRPPDSSFDMQVRAAGSILELHARRGRRAVLVVNSTPRRLQRVHSYDGDWKLALDLLAGAEPNSATSLAAMLADESVAAVKSSDLVVVTASLEPAVADVLIRSAPGRRLAVVYVDAPTFNAPRPRTRTRAADAAPLLRLQSAGVPVAVVRRGDDLGSRLDAVALEAVRG